MTQQLDELQIDGIYGQCPVQGFGKVRDVPFYFRARWDSWSFRVAEGPEGDPVDGKGYMYAEDYGQWAEAGFMPEQEARAFIARAAILYLQLLDSGALNA